MGPTGSADVRARIIERVLDRDELRYVEGCGVVREYVVRSREMVQRGVREG